MHPEGGLCVLGVGDVWLQAPLSDCYRPSVVPSATYRGNGFMNRLMIEHVGGVQSGVHRRAVAPGANLLVVAFVRGVASSGGGQ